MRFNPAFLDEIRARLPVSQVVGRKVALKKKGREWSGLSPFKIEKTPSFFVNDQKGFYHCFASGEHGDIFTFLMKTEGLEFPEAVERLAAEAGVPLPKYDRVQEEVYQRRLSLYDTMQAAADYFSEQLGSTAGVDARNYLRTRGLNQATQSEFCIGYAPPNRTALKTHMLLRGFSEAQLLECGLLIQPENGDPPFDRFRDRVMIPIHDHRGRVIAFGGRALKKEVIPKYLNSPETPLFIKGQTVFNFHRARQTAFEKDDVVVVEGYLDAIAVHQSGLKNVVATLGTAMTEAQINSLWQLASSPTVCFDGDRAGREAAFKAIHRMLPLLKPERSFRFAFMLGAKDPDELIQAAGVAAFEKIIESAVPLHDALWLGETEVAQANTPERKAAFERQIYKLVNSIEDQSVRRQYINTYRVRLSKFFWEHDDKKKKSPIFGRTPPDGLAIEKIILGMSVEYPELFDTYHERFLRLSFSETHQKFLKALVDVLITLQDRPVATIYANIDPAFFSVLDNVHGNRSPDKGLKFGHNLRARCPVLRLEPDFAFIERLFLLLVGKLEHKFEREELEDRYRIVHQAETNEVWEALARWERELHLKEEQLRAEEWELDSLAVEMAKSYHSQRHDKPQAA